MATTGFHCIGITAESFPFVKLQKGLLENVTTASADPVLNSIWVKFQFWPNYPFNVSFKTQICTMYKIL